MDKQYVFRKQPDGSIVPGRIVENNNILHELPPGIYTIDQKEDGGFSFVPENKFTLPERIYGNVDHHIDHFIKAYEHIEKNVGAMLYGQAGSGKTITLKRLAMRFVEMGYPVILINQRFKGLPAMLNLIQQNCLVCFDEFDKTHGDSSNRKSTDEDGDDVVHHVTGESQQMMLQLLDGAMVSHKKLFVFTANDLSAVSPYMFNRPSRLRYVIGYDTIELSALIDYVSTNLKDCDESMIRAYVHLAKAVDTKRFGINFDVVTELVREQNIFNNSLNDVVKMMLRNDVPDKHAFNVDVFYKGTHLGKTQAAMSDANGLYLDKDDYTMSVIITDKTTHEALVEQKNADNAKTLKETAAKIEEAAKNSTQAKSRIGRNSFFGMLDEGFSTQFFTRMTDAVVDAKLREEASASVTFNKTHFVNFGDDHNSAEYKCGDFTFVVAYRATGEKLPPLHLDITDQTLFKMSTASVAEPAKESDVVLQARQDVADEVAKIKANLKHQGY